MYAELLRRLPIENIPYAESVPLAELTTFRIGGPAPVVIYPRNIEELTRSASLCSRIAQDFYIIGRGSNILAADTGLSCPVICTRQKFSEISINDQGILRASAGASTDDCAKIAAQNGWAGINFMSGIPGTIGGAVIGNAGAFGAQIGDVVIEVETLSPQGEIIAFKPEQLKFSYRHSFFKENVRIILGVTLKLSPSSVRQLEAQRQEYLALRSQKHVDYHKVPCAGSFFKNLITPSGERQPAGALLEQAGCKTLHCGGAAVFDGHANIIINTGHATAEDVVFLADEMRARVQAMFGVPLEPEVQMVGFSPL